MLMRVIKMSYQSKIETFREKKLPKYSYHHVENEHQVNIKVISGGKLSDLNGRLIYFVYLQKTF